MQRFMINVLDLTTSISRAMDMVSPVIMGHHQRVAYLSYALGRAMETSPDRLSLIVLSASLHDIGAMSLLDRKRALDFEEKNHHVHAEMGYNHLKDFPLFSSVADVVRYHHHPWNFYSDSDDAIPEAAHILHLADRIDVLVDYSRNLLEQAGPIRDKVLPLSGTVFSPLVIDAFHQQSAKESFWLELLSATQSDHAFRNIPEIHADWSLLNLVEFSWFMARLIDFRCSFTATHSSGVSAVAEWLANLVGFSQNECQMMMIAGFLHDIGKLGVPTELINKNGKLTAEEFNQVKPHAYLTRKILAPLKELPGLVDWCAFHHERLDGSGYPYRLDSQQIPLGAKILAVADIFTALIEDRPYRKGMEIEKALEIIQDQVKSGMLDHRVVSLLSEEAEMAKYVCLTSQKYAQTRYSDFFNTLPECLQAPRYNA
ncbi:MAG: HD domain-containing protein [Magnetococcales bacterium]|nr:HD domain-containing protein [Magnetococcales bacterium]